jgi:hypothetical protein
MTERSEVIGLCPPGRGASSPPERAATPGVRTQACHGAEPS